ncbi:hypothetical protein KI387_044283 [Taxus chinensis]|uniref:Pentatricopeptide repeat-containing protein n=1 Tax=Taxus chinensis TaxID=29808 RepID=A0AA38CH13_TAXCH|nr:hypothetical protein KI387_044283 [Taxus chinensis]
MRQIVMSQAALDAAAERRRRKRKLRMEPPLNALHRNRDYVRKEPYIVSKFPEPISVLVGDRLCLHNRIQALLRDGNFDDAILGVRHAMFSNCRPTIFTCNAVLDHLQKAGKHTELLSLYKFITQSGVIPNIVTYNTVVSTHCEKLDIDAAVNILNDIYAAEMTPSTATFIQLMMAHFRLKKYEEAMRLFREMLDKCHGADPSTSAVTIEGFVNGGAIDQATELYMEMKRHGSIFSEQVFCILIRGYFATSRVSEAMEVFNFIPEKLQPTVLSYNAMLDGLFKAGRDQEGMDFFDSFKSKNVIPNASTYAIIMSRLVEQGNVDRALFLLDYMDENRAPTTAVYNALLIAHFKKHMDGQISKQIDYLVQDMLKKSCEPDAVTYTILIDGFFKEGKLEEALKMLRKIMESGFRPDVDVYNKLFGHLCNEGNLDDAQKLFQGMVGGGQNPDVATYDILKEGFSKSGRMDEIKKFFEHVLEKYNLSEELVAQLGVKTQDM